MVANDRAVDAWASGQPVGKRLPYYGYQDNQVAMALVTWVDEFLSDRKGQLERFYLELHPSTCADSSLDYLGYLCGLSGDFWSTSWDPSVKKSMVLLAYKTLWPLRGTLEVLNTILDVHSIERKIWQQAELVLPFTMARTFGGQGLRVYIRLPLVYPRVGYAWTEAKRALRNYAPACTETKVTYEQFYVGFSVLGEPMYNPDS